MKTVLFEEGAREMHALWEDASDVITASVAWVEITGAIVRRLPAERARPARRRALRQWQVLYVLDVDDALVLSAARAAEDYRLRALDAIHLAAARSVYRRDLVFATWDAELAEAARASGLAVAP